MEKKATERDPVCDMKIKDECKFTSAYKGKEYHFCSNDCKKAFDIAPGKYVEDRVQNEKTQKVDSGSMCFFKRRNRGSTPILDKAGMFYGRMSDCYYVFDGYILW